MSYQKRSKARPMYFIQQSPLATFFGTPHLMWTIIRHNEQIEGKEIKALMSHGRFLLSYACKMEQHYLVYIHTSHKN